MITAGVCNGATGYDALNRPLVKQNANPATAPAAQIEKIVYCYDGRVKTGDTCGGAEATVQLGQMTSVGTADSTTDYTFDAVGRLTASVQRTVGLANQGFTYGYYRSDLRGETVYPSGRRIVTCADGLLRPVWLSHTKTMADCQQNIAVNNSANNSARHFFGGIQMEHVFHLGTDL